MPLDPLPDDQPQPPPLTLTELLQARTPRLIATPAIALLQIALFGVMTLAALDVAFQTSSLIARGGQSAPAIADGEWWRFLTPMVLHGGVLHLALNTVLLWQLGGYVERLLGPLVFTIVYVLCGVIATVVSLQLHPSGLVSIGASGAVFGLAGVLLTVAFAGGRGAGHRLGAMLGELQGSLISFIVYNAIAGVVLPRIDNAAHAGGLIGGLALGWLVGRHSLAARPTVALTLLPMALTVLLAAAEMHLLASRHDVPMERHWFDQMNARARAALVTAVQDVDAGRQTPEQAAAGLERTVAPSLREARERAARLQRAGEGRPTIDTLAWSAFVAAEADVWQMRFEGLPPPMRQLLAQANHREQDARRTLDETLARHAAAKE
jgi:membrane associated rhomboid family serine protease